MKCKTFQTHLQRKRREVNISQGGWMPGKDTLNKTFRVRVFKIFTDTSHLEL